jgi:hypothetical protein
MTGYGQAAGWYGRVYWGIHPSPGTGGDCCFSPSFGSVALGLRLPRHEVMGF